MHETTINENRSWVWKTANKGIRKGWREEKEINVGIIISKHKKIIIKWSYCV